MKFIPQNANQTTMIIAGASQGIGKQLAHDAAAKGFNLALLARDKEKLDEICQDIIKKYPFSKCIPIVVDLTDSSKTTLAINKITEADQGKISCLVNTAATWTGGKSINEITADSMKNSIDLNFFTAFNPIKALISLPETHTTRPLTIINIGATASTRGGNHMAEYAVAKSSVKILSQSLAKELGPKGVHVAHIVVDGLIDNERTRKLNPDTPNEKYIQMSALTQTIFSLYEQDPSCWTNEIDVRPYTEKW